MKPRIGFVINGRVPSLAAIGKGMNPLSLLRGWDDAPSPMSEMRFRWIARHVSGSADYRLYRAGAAYDAVVFVKSMTEECLALARSLRDRGIPVMFDANVDYYTPAGSGNMPGDLVPTESQRRQAYAMTEFADSVIASSRHLAGICGAINPSSRWIPDNVEPSLVPSPSVARKQPKILDLWWSGMPQKTIDLLALAEVLPGFGSRVRLNLVTGDLGNAMKRMKPSMAEGLKALLAGVPHEIHRYRTVSSLLSLYSSRPGVIISPRFLDNPYNLSHSEWKITLGMACGLPAITSPQPSYLDVRERCRNRGALTVCNSDEDWVSALGKAMDPAGREELEDAARLVVAEHYATPVVAALHLEAVRSCLGG